MKTIFAKSLLSSLIVCQALSGFRAFADPAQDSPEKVLTARRMALNQAVEGKTGDAETYQKNLTDKDPMIRELSIKGLETLGATDAAAQVTPLALKDPDPSVREEAAQALKAWKNPASLSAWIQCAKDPVVDIRVLCVQALGESPDPAAHKAVLAAAKDQAPEVRRTVMDQFVHASNPDVVPAVTAALSDSDPSVRANAAQAIGFYAKLHMPDELKMLLNDSDPVVQASAARFLIQAGDADGLKTALELCKSTDQTTQLLAIDALGYSQDPEAKTAVAQIYASDPDSYAREAAHMSLKRIGLKRNS